MFELEVGSRSNPKYVISSIIIGIILAAVAFAFSHNLIVHPWLVIERHR